MNIRLAAIYLVVAAAMLAGSHKLSAQEGTADGPDPVAARFAQSYDSLLNSYYLRRHAHNTLRASREFSVEEFDALPDSVIERRMRSLHTVIPMTYNSEVRSFIRFYLRHMSTRLDVMLTLCEYYHPMFEEALSRYGVPEELKYLTIVESAMNPEATSRVGAAGLWQFMYSTGKLYDLEVNSVVDDRRDPHKSTVAAARHLKDLHTIFGDWQLAIAAYNCGAGNVNKAIARSGGKRSFWEIYGNLPRETRGYVPAFIAVVYVMNNYDKHGLRPSHLSLPVRSDTVMLHDDVMMGYVAKALSMDADELHTLNPQYRAGFIPASSGNYSICLPAAKIETFIGLLDSVTAWTRDSLERKPMKIEPSRGGKAATGGGGKYYTVRRGDTLYKVASKHGISVAKLKKLNGLRSDKIRAGQKLKVK
jgi:membrane-bound lytic murein transglycosylase D